MRWLVVVIMVLGYAAGAAEPAMAQEQLERALAPMAPVVGKATTYQRKAKESIYEIARGHGVSGSAIHNANEGDLLAGDEALLIPTEYIPPLVRAEGIVVNLPERNLYVYRDGRVVRRYPVAIGMRGWETPVGEFTVVNRRKNPTWFPPKWAIEEKPVPPGPRNPLGDRWMGLSIRGYGIHATNAPASIGRYVSHGCMRMYPEQAHELYEVTPVGTPVQIVYRRAVLGVRREEGVVYLAYYPDPYGAGEVTVEQVRQMLKGYGLGEVMDVRAVEAALARPQGVPTPVVGSKMKVKVNGSVVKFGLGPTPAGSDWLVPAGPLVEAMGARAEVGPGANYVVIERGDTRVFLSPGDREALVNGELVELGAAPQLAAGYPMIPLRATVLALGASAGWDVEANTLLVWDRAERAAGIDRVLASRGGRLDRGRAAVEEEQEEGEGDEAGEGGGEDGGGDAAGLEVELGGVDGDVDGGGHGGDEDGDAGGEAVNAE